MTTKEELLKEIEALKAKVEALENTPKEVTRFKPEECDDYYTILFNGTVYQAVNYDIELSYKFGNTFRDEEIAERYAKHRAARQRLELLALELNGPDFPIVPSPGVECYSLYGCYTTPKGANIVDRLATRSESVVFKTRELAKKAIDLTTNEDLIELFGVGKE